MPQICDFTPRNIPPSESEDSRPFLAIVRAGGPGVTVIMPLHGKIDGEAGRIVPAVRARYGVKVPVMTGDRALQGLSTSHTIALGCLSDNPFIEALYLRWNTLVDRWYPGRLSDRERKTSDPDPDTHPPAKRHCNAWRSRSRRYPPDLGRLAARRHSVPSIDRDRDCDERSESDHLSAGPR